MLINSTPETVLVASWRLSRGTLPLQHRHLSALVENGVGSTLYAWVLSRIEWAISHDAIRHPNGVLTITIDPEGDVALTAADLPEAPTAEEVVIVVSEDGIILDGATASVWARFGNEVITPSLATAKQRGTRSLVRDLAKTLRYDVFEDVLTQERADEADELFLVSDAFGVIALNDRNGEFAQKMADSLAKAWR